MSHCRITGIFRTRGSVHITQYRPASSTIFSTHSSTFVRFAHYTCPICANSSHLAFAIIRAAKPLNNNALLPMAAVFVIGTIFVQPSARPWIIEADHFHVVPRDPSSPTYYMLLYIRQAAHSAASQNYQLFSFSLQAHYI
jgi:hypothetical protein